LELQYTCIVYRIGFAIGFIHTTFQIDIPTGIGKRGGNIIGIVPIQIGWFATGQYNTLIGYQWHGWIGGYIISGSILE
jgi:hypothetical protein